MQPNDLLLGRIALTRGLITQEQLDSCIALQADDQMAGREVHPLGTVLVAQGHLTEVQLHEILDDQLIRLEDLAQFEEARKTDVLFGRLVIQRELASVEQVNECLREQAAIAERGRGEIPRLGLLLVARGFLTANQVAEVIGMQGKAILECRLCGVRLNAESFRSDLAYPCPRCGGVMVPVSAPDHTGVSGVWTEPPASPVV